MALDDLARALSDPSRPGLTAELCDKLKIRSADVTRGQLMAREDDDAGHLGVYLLGAYVVDDTDVWGDGEVYWWVVPTLVDKAGKARWSPLDGIPTGGAPHKVGSLEWMTNLSLKDPPLLAAIPPDDEVAACVLRLAFYDDDGAPADVPMALRAGLEVLAAFTTSVVASAEQLVLPVREAIVKSLAAAEDDILVDQDVTLRRGDRSRFSAGLVGSEINARIRTYYFVRDERRTTQAGPFVLHKGQIETVRFPALATGGKIAVFARGADVTTTVFGTLTTDLPFVNRVVDANMLVNLRDGLQLTGTGPAKVVAYYTPP